MTTVKDYIVFLKASLKKQNPACGKHRISQPMRIVASIFFSADFAKESDIFSFFLYNFSFSLFFWFNFFLAPSPPLKIIAFVIRADTLSILVQIGSGGKLCF